MAKTPTEFEAPAAAERFVEVRLLRDYVPRNPQDDEDAELRAAGIYRKVKTPAVLSLPRDEAKRVIDLKIAEITADLI